MDSSKKRYWVGFDLGGTKMLATVYDDALNPLGSKKRRTHGSDGAEAGMARMAESIDAALAKAGVARGQLAGIGIGTPGPVDLEKGILLSAPNMGWKNVPIKSVMAKTFGCPVELAKDVDLGVYGEYRFGAAKDARCVVGLFPGTGVGGGCVYEGRIFRGRYRSCMEIGHVPVIEDGPLCGCGRYGCLEAVASRLAVSAAAAAAKFRGAAPHLATGETGIDLDQIRSSSLAEAIAAGDEALAAIIRNASRWMARVLGGVVNMLDPDVIILGGGLVEAAPDMIRSEIEKQLPRYVMPSFEGTYKIKLAKLGDDAVGMGAAAWVKEQLDGKK